MRDFLFSLDPGATDTLQTQLRQQLVSAIVDGQLLPGQPVPSSRRLAKQLGIARNTVMLVYQYLVEQGFLISRERSGYYVNGEMGTPPLAAYAANDATAVARPVDWTTRLATRLSVQRNISKPLDWQSYPYPFIYGQVDPRLFPLAAWRECSRLALAKPAVSEWAVDHVAADDPTLLEQLRTRVLPRRGVRAADQEILITMGAQNALWLLSSLLVTDRTTVGLENPGYVDARNIFSLSAGETRALPIDHEGMMVGAALTGCQYICVTPSHQSPSTVTMPLARRRALLERAERDDIVIIEDDYEGEMNYVGEATPALKSLDRAGRVLYIGSLSKNMAPGLRLGYLVGPADLIDEARHLRRLMLRHPPTNNQLTMALFLANGHYDSLVHRLHRVYRERWRAMAAALERYLPQSHLTPTFGGTSFWVAGPKRLDAAALAERALARGIIIEPGEVHFAGPKRPRNYFRLGFSSVERDRIEPGIKLLAGLIREQDC